MRWFILSLIAVACSTAPAQQVTKINNVDLMGLLKNSDIQLVDIRTPNEVAQGFIEGAVHIDFLADGFLDEMNKLDKDKPLVIYCRSGNRSGKAASQLSKQGFKEILDATEGFAGWERDGYPIATK